MWLALHHTILTLKFLQKKKVGPNICLLCRSDAKTCTTHLFIKFPFIKHVWKYMEDNLGKHAIWNEASIEGRLKIWLSDQN